MLVDEVLTRRIIGAFYEVYDELGYGYLEIVYARALELELRERGLEVEREVPLAVRYKGTEVGTFRADLVVESRVMLELKALPQVGIAERNQLLSYLTSTSIELGLLLNFGPRAFFRRVIATRDLASQRRHPR